MKHLLLFAGVVAALAVPAGAQLQDGEKPAEISAIDGVIAAGSDDEVTIEVRNDSGTIPAEQQETIFDPLRLAVAAKEDATEPPERGLGLGLYIARRSVEQLGGEIWIDDAEGGGAAFSFTLPAHSGPVEGTDRFGVFRM